MPITTLSGGEKSRGPSPCPSPGGRGDCPPCLSLRPSLNFSQFVEGQRYKWLQVLGCAEPPHIDERIGHQLHPVVPTLKVLETQQQPLEFVLPRECPLNALP